MSRLAELERTIEHGREALVAMARALLEVRDEALYRDAGYKTFDSYCQKRWGISHSRAYQLCDFAEVHDAMPVENEFQARKIAPAFKADPDGVLSVFGCLARDLGPEAAVRELARNGHLSRHHRTTSAVVSRHQRTRRAAESGTVYVVLGLGFNDVPDVDVVASESAALDLRDELIRSKRFRKVVIVPCLVKDQAQEVAS